MYNPRSPQAEAFISHDEIVASLEYGRRHKEDAELIAEILEKAARREGLTHREVAVLLSSEDKDVRAKVAQTAMDIKEEIYGKRIVFFAPLYLSNYCVNHCTYCGYHANNKEMPRKKLTQEEIRAEVIALQDMGHKRLALEVGEHEGETPLEYVLESLKTIYETKHKNGAIRRVNVNIAATTQEAYERLSAAEIGTYILFQETYDRKAYERYHPRGPKSDYAYHTEAMDRAMAGGIDDVGIGVLYGLSDYRYDTVGMMLHVEHLEARFGVGPHTISLPRLRSAGGMELGAYTLVGDEDFFHVVAVLRCAVPYTGMIISTRESGATRAELLRLGISQLSGGSCTGVGGYAESAACGDKPGADTSQFSVDDHRSLDQIMHDLLLAGYLPSFCTACYREGRTGDRFMQLAKSGEIKNVCQPNALLTLSEYAIDYATEQTKSLADSHIQAGLGEIVDPKAQEETERRLQRVQAGGRDERF